MSEFLEEYGGIIALSLVGLLIISSFIAAIIAIVNV